MTIEPIWKMRRRVDAARAAQSDKMPLPKGLSAAALKADLELINGFGTNPGALRLYAFCPDQLAAKPALVVALHGCGQDAATFAVGTGWTTLANECGFVLICPEQQRANNPNTCFNWFEPADSTRNMGEAQSIREMVAFAIQHYGVDPSKVYVTGLSAGGAMTSVMLANYPEVFAAGAIIAGLPFGVASNVGSAYDAMLRGTRLDGDDLGDRVRNASTYDGPWPKVTIWHGKSDSVVVPDNGEHCAAQWVNVHRASGVPELGEVLDDENHLIWRDRRGRPVVELISVPGLAHGVPLKTGSGEGHYGLRGPYLIEAGISSTWHIAKFWGLLQPSDKATHEQSFRRRAATGLATKRSSDRVVNGGREPRLAMTADGSSAPVFDQAAIVAAALEAAGLGKDGRLNVAAKSAKGPASIITAALTAAGLMKR